MFEFFNQSPNQLHESHNSTPQIDRSLRPGLPEHFPKVPRNRPVKLTEIQGVFYGPQLESKTISQ